MTAEALHQVPEHLEVSIEGLEAGTQVTAGDVELPAGVELAADPELIVAVDRPPRRPPSSSRRRCPRSRRPPTRPRPRSARPPRAPRARPAAEGDETTEARTEA